MLSWGTPFVFKAYTRIGREASSGENEKTIRGKTKGKLMHITLQKKVKGENHCTWLKLKFITEQSGVILVPTGIIPT